MGKAVKVEAGATTVEASESLILKKNEIPFLPRELIFNILVRLRADEVYKFRSICRSWYNLIHDHVFIQSHLERSIPGLFIRQHYVLNGKSTYEADFIEMKDRKDTKQDKKFGRIGWVMGSCNGLVLLRTEISSFYVANLITKQRVNLPSTTNIEIDYWNFSLFGRKCDPCRFSCGFTYVPETGIYKLVNLLMDEGLALLTCEVLSLGFSGCNMWRCVNGSSISLSDEEDWEFEARDPVTINGIVYFVGARIAQSFSIDIVSFDAGAEVFHKIRAPVPEITVDDTFLELGGVLSFVEATDPYTYDIWILKDWLKGIWEIQYIISIRNPFMRLALHWSYSPCFPQVLSSFSHGGRKVIIFQSKSISGNLYRIAYDLELNRESEFYFDTTGDPFESSFTHVNSLISPKLL